MSSDELRDKNLREDWHPLGPCGPEAEEMAVEHRQDGHPADPLELAYIAKCPLCYARGLERDAA